MWFVSVGVPPGVVNMVFGTGPRAGDALVGHPDVPLVSFTGSTATAQHITERSAPYCKKLSLELGGKNPAIIFADADLDKCIETTVRSSFSNQVRNSEKDDPHYTSNIIDLFYNNNNISYFSVLTNLCLYKRVFWKWYININSFTSSFKITEIECC